METGTGMSALVRFHHDLQSLRSHHWKYHVDLYEGCYFNCKYCLYILGDQPEKVRPRRDVLPQLEADFAAMKDSKGIVYLGPKADIYQPLERKEKLTRGALKMVLKYGVPLFMITRSDLILRDVDVLRELAEAGLVEVSFTICSPSTYKVLEGGSPPVERRLEVARTLVENGIPVSFHLSPVIPGWATLSELKELMVRMRDAGAECIYACMLGMRDSYRAKFLNAIASIDVDKAAFLADLYPDGMTEGRSVQSADQAYAYNLMRELADFSRAQGIPFACVHFPLLDTVERRDHIFRYRLPTVGDIYRHLNDVGATSITWEELERYLRSFPAADKEYLALVSSLYTGGILFDNTDLHPVVSEGRITCYTYGETVRVRMRNMACDQREWAGEGGLWT